MARTSKIDTAIDLELTLPGGEVDKLIEAVIYDSSWSEVETVDLVHIAAGTYGADATIIPESLADYIVKYNIYDEEDVISDIYGTVTERVSIVSDIEENMSNIIAVGEAAIGNGLGSTNYESSITGSGGVAVKNAVVRAYPLVDGVADFDTIVARDVTDGSGDYDFWLDPGDYILRVEKNGTVYLTEQFTVA